MHIAEQPSKTAPQTKQALLFDMDGTMFDNMAFHGQSWLRFFAQRNIELDEAQFFSSTAGRQNHEIFRSYLRADLTGLQKLAVQAFDMMENVALRNKLKETLITKRNLLMVERMQPRLADGNAFIAVGALHLPADDGLLNLLEQGGYYIHVVND